MHSISHLVPFFVAVVAEYDADELVTQREAVSADIRERLILRAQNYNIILRDVSITNLEFR
jgi:regulator of protease activity HflC (stomatin/prohibitin superfamily)